MSLTARCGGLAVVCALFGAACAARGRPAVTSAPLPGEQLLVGSSLDPRWTTSADAPLSAAPAFDAAAAYAPFVSGEVVALDLDSGAVLWRAPVATTRSPTSGGGLVFVVAPTGLQALSAKTGAVVWERALPGAIAGPVYWDTGWLIVSFEGGDLAALRASDGELLWRRPLGAVVRVPPAPGLANLYLGMADGRLLAVELASGRPVWNRPLDAPASGLAVVGDELVVGTSGQYLLDLELRTGRQRWRWRVGAAVLGSVVADSRHLYVVAYDHVLRALDRRSGNLRWRRGLAHRPAGSPVLVGNTVLVPLLATELAAYDSVTGAPALSTASAGEVAGEVHIRVGGSARGTRLVALSVEHRLLAFGPRIEPAATPLGDLPGATVAEPRPPATQPPGGGVAGVSADRR